MTFFNGFLPHKLFFDLNRKLTFVVVEHEGKNYLKVVSCENSSLHVNDLLLVYRMRKGEILEAEKVIRDYGLFVFHSLFAVEQ